MEKATIKNMELGNILFGNSRGAYHVVPREEYQNIFCEFLNNNGFDMYGYKQGHNNREFENDTFIIRPYYWGDSEEIAKLSNFVYKPTGLAIDWYKYPMRDAYSNQDVSVEEFKTIMDACENSLKGENNEHMD